MKKTYQIPTIDIAEIRFCAALLNVSFYDNNMPTDGDNTGSLPDKNAPGRKLF